MGFASAGHFMSIVTPDRGERQLGKILETLALLKPNGNLPLQALVEIYSAHLTRGTTVVLITSSVNRDVSMAVDALRFRGIHPIVVLVDPKSFGGEFGPEDIYREILSRGVPAAVVKNGSDIRKELEGGSPP